MRCGFVGQSPDGSALSPKDGERLTPKKIIALFGGWGVGKTEYTSLEHVMLRQARHNTDVLHLIAANTYSQLFDSTLRPLFGWLKRLDIPHYPAELPNTHNPFSIYLSNGHGWVEFLVRSMENIDTISGVTLGSAWGDEMWGTEKWTFDLIMSRIRDVRSKMLQFVITSNTDEPDHWLYTEIVQKYELNTIGVDGVRPRDVMEVIHGTSFENKKNLPDRYIEDQAIMLDKQMYERFIMCKWVSLGAGKMFYNFDRNANISSKAVYDKRLPLMVSSDFNLNPMCWSFWQLHKEELWCIDQLMVTGSADTLTCCKELKNRYFPDQVKVKPDVEQPYKKIIWFGDASGRSGSTKSQNSDYDIIENFFRINRIPLEMRVRLANPSVRDSANAVNARLKNSVGKVNLLFNDRRCPDVILSVDGARYRPGTHEKDDSKDKDPNQKVKTHFSDTARYIVNELFPLRHQPTWSQSK
jgi:hypothetical protein